ncbi:hypothetical protein DFQ28_009081 [Apophysomyces sp. BC1034]|nr:hypothetical protein DFQ29_008884 [Apophysomyces sp. BC1021]KAG0173042.1 hypothetical protein DFQ30_009059 [Apophysomyces sp. BC1015]KAG0192470.1 hypothetical protein DFQ28_009081 [Apophysomyces sp. BC1034]
MYSGKNITPRFAWTTFHIPQCRKPTWSTVVHATVPRWVRNRYPRRESDTSENEQITVVELASSSTLTRSTDTYTEPDSSVSTSSSSSTSSQDYTPPVKPSYPISPVALPPSLPTSPQISTSSKESAHQSSHSATLLPPPSLSRSHVYTPKQPFKPLLNRIDPEVNLKWQTHSQHIRHYYENRQRRTAVRRPVATKEDDPVSSGLAQLAASTLLYVTEYGAITEELQRLVPSLECVGDQ